jgi:hypothetical protein
MIYYFNDMEIWSTQSEGHIPAVATLLADGNFVLIDQAGKIYWQTKTAGLLGDQLIIQNDGNIVLYSSSSSAVWASNTAGH